jgi:hypothetical protein
VSNVRELRDTYACDLCGTGLLRRQLTRIGGVDVCDGCTSRPIAELIATAAMIGARMQGVISGGQAAPREDRL